jgi:hypothetical protein
MDYGRDVQDEELPWAIGFTHVSRGVWRPVQSECLLALRFQSLKVGSCICIVTTSLTMEIPVIYWWQMATPIMLRQANTISRLMPAHLLWTYYGQYKNTKYQCQTEAPFSYKISDDRFIKQFFMWWVKFSSISSCWEVFISPSIFSMLQLLIYKELHLSPLMRQEQWTSSEWNWQRILMNCVWEIKKIEVMRLSNNSGTMVSIMQKCITQ